MDSAGAGVVVLWNVMHGPCYRFCFLFVYSTGCMERGEGVFTSLVYFTWDGGGEDSARSLESLVCSGLLGYVDLGIVFTGKVME